MALTLDFADKHVFVFGGTTGINFGITETFARHGAKVSVASRKQENVDTAVSSLAAAGGSRRRPDDAGPWLSNGLATASA